jgi:hypothetical protein
VRTVLSKCEVELLDGTIRDAFLQGSRGELTQGYDLLLLGLRYAEEVRDQGERCGAVLVLAWRGLILNYCHTYGVKMRPGAGDGAGEPA